MKESLNVIVAGATGYIGIELVKILSSHPRVKIKYICAQKFIGKSLSNFDPFFKKKNLPKISNLKKANFNNIDVIFTALPNGESQKIAKELNSNTKLIDLSADFRLRNVNDYKKWYKIKHKAKKLIKDSLYCIPELTKNDIRNFKIIACPGCSPTSIQIPLIPLIKKNLIDVNNIIVDSKSGYSGAGKNLNKKFKFKNIYNSVNAYNVGFHRHSVEIDQELNKFLKKNIKIQFTPHLSPMFRGILSTIYITLKKNTNPLKTYKYLKKYYKNNFFIKIAKFNESIGTGDVMHTNNCKISICSDRKNNKAIILCSIDNLIKGGAGQAIQIMNKLFGFKDNLGFK